MIKNGDLYALPLLPGAGFVTAHVVLSIEQVEHAGQAKATSRIHEYGSLLIDVYGPATVQPSATANERLIHGIWIDDGSIAGPSRPRWKRIGHRDVDAAGVEFPELVLNNSGNGFFARGELTKPLPFDSSDVERIDCRTPFVSAGKLLRICTNLVGRGDLLGEEKCLFELDRNVDLRYNANRDAVYRTMGIDPTRRYFEWATAEGLDPGRFWK